MNLAAFFDFAEFIILGGVVDDIDRVVWIIILKNRFKAFESVPESIPVQDNHGDMRRVVVHGRGSIA